MKNTIEVTSSNGSLTVDRASGVVIKCRMEENGEGIDKILRFNLEEFCGTYCYPKNQIPHTIDILDLGYWHKHFKKEEYEEPADDWRKEFRLNR